jgi:hypothetical protein
LKRKATPYKTAILLPNIKIACGYSRIIFSRKLSIFPQFSSNTLE